MAWTLSRRDFISHTKQVAMVTPLLGLTACWNDHDDDLIAFNGQTMGTTYSIRLASLPASVERRVLASEIDALLASVDQAMSTYRQDSELSRFNEAGAMVWTSMSADTMTVVEQSHRLHALTGGAFDPTVGPVVDLWGFGPGDGNRQVPAEERLRAVASVVGFDSIEADGIAFGDGSAAIRKQTAGVRLDFSGVAKGFGVDKVARHLDRAGVDNYLVEVGGELRASGHAPGGRSWRIGIEKPTQTIGDLEQIIDLRQEALATSGNYRIFFEEAGQRYPHIINPKSGRPVDHDLASVSVLAETTLEADALSTALLVLGPDDGMALAEAMNIQALFISGSEGAFHKSGSTAFNRRSLT